MKTVIKVYSKQASLLGCNTFTYLLSPCQTSRLFRRTGSRILPSICVIILAIVLSLQAQAAQTNRTIDSLLSVLQPLPKNKERADVLVTLCRAMLDVGASERETTPFGQELLDISQRLSYERGVAWGISIVARRYERRDNVLFGQYSYDALHRFGDLRDTAGLAFAERNVAVFHFYSADYALASRFYDQALQRFQEMNNLPQVAWILHFKAILHGYQGNYIVSLSNQFKALRLFEQKLIPVGIASANQDLGIALQKIGSTAKALEYFQKALAVYVPETITLDQQEHIAEIRANIAECYRTQSNTPRARTELDSALYAVARTTTTFGKIVYSSIYDTKGSIARQQDSTAQALQYFERALMILDSAEVRGNDANFAVYRIASLHYSLHEYELASSAFHKMLERSLRSGDKRNSSRAMLWLGKTAYEQRSFDEARRYGREALAAAQSIGQLEFASQSSELLAKTFEQINDTKTSLSYAKLTQELRDSIATLERTQQLVGMEALYSLDKERSVSELLKKDNEAQTLISVRQRWLLIAAAIILVGGLVGSIVLTRLNTRMKSTNTELARQTERVRMISRIGAEIASNLDLESAIVMVYGHVNQLMDAPIFNIGDYVPHEHCIKMRYLIENGEFVPPPTVRMNDETRPAVRCVRQRVPIVMNDVDIPVLVGVKPASLVYVPLISGDRVVGVFSVQSLKPNSYPQENVDLLVAISSYIATAMENATAFARIKKQQSELEQQAAAIQLTNVTLSEQNMVLEKLNFKVTENIAYAETIQRAVLPLETDMTDLLGEHFVFYKPMEVISGDFYWLQRTEFATLVAVVDCTGHGIPGAFMSMIGNDLLNQIVLEKGITSPSWILTELHYAVRHALKQTNDLTSNQDGMDVCLCRIEPGGITFAGARRSLYIVQNGELLELEGDTKPIGGFQRESKRNFTSKRLDLSPGNSTMLYLTSDGFADQHNKKREKFGIKRLTQLFQTLSTQDISTQHSELEKALMQHQGSVAQRDDITVMGIRIKAQ